MKRAEGVGGEKERAQTKDLNKHFPCEDIQITNTYMERCMHH